MARASQCVIETGTNAPSIRGWTLADCNAAEREGWGLLVPLDPDAGSPLLGRVVAEVRHRDDRSVWHLVRTRAERGSKLHCRALAVLAAHNRAEHALVMRQWPNYVEAISIRRLLENAIGFALQIARIPEIQACSPKAAEVIVALEAAWSVVSDMSTMERPALLLKPATLETLKRAVALFRSPEVRSVDQSILEDIRPRVDVIRMVAEMMEESLPLGRMPEAPIAHEPVIPAPSSGPGHGM